MKATERDIRILQFINQFGFCEIPQIEREFGLKRPRSYQVMKRLVAANLLCHERVFHGRHGVFYLTKNAAKDYSDLPAIKNIPKDNYIHQLTIIEIYFQLKKQFPEARWISERYLFQDKKFYGVKYRRRQMRRSHHIADGMLILPNDEQIAIEVELSMKNKERIEDIMLSYGLTFGIHEVWYYCSPEIINRVRKAAENKPYIKTHSL